jgi:beta-lactam-binding protein with PASTA domain
VAVASKHVRDHPPAPRELNPSIPPTFEAIILKAMAKDPAHRYATAEELRADLLRFNEGRTVLAMDDATAMLAAAGATQAVGAVGRADDTRAIGAVGALPGEEEADEAEIPNRTRTYAIILAILLALLLVAGFFLLRNLGYLGGGTTFPLPPVAGQTTAQATTKLAGEGLVVKTANQVSSDTPGTVLSTDPSANSLVKKGDTVTLKVAVGPSVKKVTVPTGLTGVSQGVAESTLASAGLTATIVDKPSNTVTKGNVISASPASGSRTAIGSPVTLTVSSGLADVTVPSLIGLPQGSAYSLLAQQGLNVGTVNAATSSQPAGVVTDQNPGAGAQVSPGTQVNLQVSAGPPSTTTTSSTTSTTSTTSPSSSSTTTATTSSNGRSGTPIG